MSMCVYGHVYVHMYVGANTCVRVNTRILKNT